MKKILTALVLSAIISASSFAADAGKYYAIGAIGYLTDSTSYNGTSGTSSSESGYEFSISPQIGFNITDKLDAGLGFTYYTTKKSSKYSSSGSTGYGIAPYVRYELAKSGDFRFLAKFLVSYDTSKADYSGAQAVDTYGLLLSPVVEYKVTKYFSLVATAGVLGLTFTSQGKVNTTTFGFNRGLGGELGVSFNFL
ncbi:MAG: hypothetical protein FWC57_03670 [Endomicrobia bacterium]|nr:hypothetical protein [Endomicrobiia bacterium]